MTWPQARPVEPDWGPRPAPPNCGPELSIFTGEGRCENLPSVSYLTSLPGFLWYEVGLVAAAPPCRAAVSARIHSGASGTQRVVVAVNTSCDYKKRVTLSIIISPQGLSLPPTSSPLSLFAFSSLPPPPLYHFSLSASHFHKYQAHLLFLLRAPAIS